MMTYVLLHAVCTLSLLGLSLLRISQFSSGSTMCRANGHGDITQVPAQSGREGLEKHRADHHALSFSGLPDLESPRQRSETFLAMLRSKFARACPGFPNDMQNKALKSCSEEESIHKVKTGNKSSMEIKIKRPAKVFVYIIVYTSTF